MYNSKKNSNIAKRTEKVSVRSSIDQFLAKVDENAAEGLFECSLEVVSDVYPSLIKELKRKGYVVCIKRSKSRTFEIQIYWGPSNNRGSMYYKVSKDKWLSDKSIQGFKKI